MELQEIRNMNDEQLERFLKSLSMKKSTNCYKCGKNNSNFTINIQNKKAMQQKKLCCLCETCYNDLLDYLAINDIKWEN